MKRENVFKVAIIFVVLAITGGMISFMFAKRAQAPAGQTTTVQPITATKPLEKKIPEVKNEMLQDRISVVGNKIFLSLPVGWGDLIVPKSDANGDLIDSGYGTQDRQPILSSFGIDVEKLEGISTRMISAYNYGEKSEYNEAPTVVVYNYPASFIGDKQNDPDVLRPRTAKQKEESFQPILDVFKKGNIDGMDLSQKCFTIKDVTGENDSCVRNARSGFWWDNFFAIYDRIGVRYFQNSTGDLRGIGYFDVSGQEIPDTISGYKVILVNPEKRMLVYIYLPLEGTYSFGMEKLLNLSEKTPADKWNNFYATEAPKIIQKAYAYLENPENYKDQKLGQFLREIDAMVSSVKIVSQ